MKLSKNFNFGSFFSIWRSKKLTPQPGFLKCYYNVFSNYTCNSSKKSVRCKWNWKVLKGDKSSEIIEKFYFWVIFFYMMQRKIDPPPWFLKCYYNLLSNYTSNSSKKNQLDASETGKCWKETKVVKISKKFIFESFFLYNGANKWPTTHQICRNLALINFQFILAIFQKKIVGCKWNWKVLNADKSSENTVFGIGSWYCPSPNKLDM